MDLPAEPGRSAGSDPPARDVIAYLKVMAPPWLALKFVIQ